MTLTDPGQAPAVAAAACRKRANQPLIRCGLRASDAATLDFGCLIHDGHDGQGAPYLRYVNHKIWALVNRLQGASP